MATTESLIREINNVNKQIKRLEHLGEKDGGNERDLMKKSVGVFLETLNSVDSKFVTSSMVEKASQNIYSMLSMFNAFVTSKNNSNLEKLINNIDALNTHTNNLKLYIDYDFESVTNQVSDIMKKIETIQTHLVEVEFSIKNYDKLQIAMQKGMDNHVEASRNQFDTSINREKEKVSARINTYFEKESKLLTSKITNIKRRFETNLSEIELKKNEVNKLLSVLSNDATVGEYLSAKNYELKRSFWWRLATIVLFVITLGLSIYIFVDVISNIATYENLSVILTRLLLITTLSALIAYTSKIAANHKYLFRYYRQITLELNSIDLYISSFEEKDKLLIKRVLAEKYYAQAKFPNKKGEDDDAKLSTISNIIEIIKNSQT